MCAPGGNITGASADPSGLRKGADVFFKRANAARANMETNYWFVGYDRTFEGAVGSPSPATPTRSSSTRTQRATDTVASITGSDMNWIKSQPWYTGQKIGLGEFGMPVDNGDAAMAKFYTNVPSQLQGTDIDGRCSSTGSRTTTTRSRIVPTARCSRRRSALQEVDGA